MTKQFIVELKQEAGYQNLSFSIKRDWHTLPGSPSSIIATNAYTGSALLPDKKRHRPSSCRVKTPLIESIPWQWLYASQLLTGFKLVLTTKEASPGSNSYSWLPVAVVFGWLLKSYRNLDFPLFNPIERQSAFLLTHGDHLFSAITTVFGSENNPPQYQPSEASGLQPPQTTIHLAGSFTSFVYSHSADGNGGPQQHQHTLALNCYIYPCNGICRFRPSSNDGEPDAWSLNFAEFSTGSTVANPGQGSCPHLTNGSCFSCEGHFDPVSAEGSEQNLPFETFIDLCEIQYPFDYGQLFQAYNIDDNPANSGALNTGDSYTIDATGLLNYGMPMSGNDCLHREGTPPEQTPHCQKALSDHKVNNHTRQPTCNATVVENDGQLRPCGTICKSAKALKTHKSRVHSGQKTCNVTVIAEDGRQRPCGLVCKSSSALTDHKRSAHSGQKACDLIVVGENGQTQPCDKAYKNIKSLLDHKRRDHSGQQTCNLTVVGEDGKPRPCGKVSKNSGALSSHKFNFHSGQRTCIVTVVGKDGQQRPCGTVCNNAKTLSNHKRKEHSGEKTCNLTVVGEDGQRRSCGAVCKNARALSDHKSRHRKRKSVQDDEDP